MSDSFPRAPFIDLVAVRERVASMPAVPNGRCSGDDDDDGDGDQSVSERFHRLSP